MSMSRHLYWLILLNMVANVVAYVPRMLLKERFSGMVLAIVVATILGTICLLWYTGILSRFPGQGMPEILKNRVPSFLRSFLMMMHGVLWFSAGLITLLIFSDITKTFLNPNTNIIVIVVLFGLASSSGALLETKLLLALLEILLLMNIPLMAFIFLKAYTNEFFNWDMVWMTIKHFYELPSWTSISSAFYIFLGFSNLVIFNRAIPKLNRKWLWIVPPAGLMVLCTTTLVPIAMNGTVLIGEYTFPWITTADTLRMQFGFVERMLFVFLLLYITIALLSVMIHWHVSIEFFKSVLPLLQKQETAYMPLLVAAMFITAACFMICFMNEAQIYRFSAIWMSLTIPFLLFTLLILTWMARKRGT